MAKLLDKQAIFSKLKNAFYDVDSTLPGSPSFNRDSVLDLTSASISPSSCK